MKQSPVLLKWKFNLLSLIKPNLQKFNKKVLFSLKKFQKKKRKKIIIWLPSQFFGSQTKWVLLERCSCQLVQETKKVQVGVQKIRRGFKVKYKCRLYLILGEILEEVTRYSTKMSSNQVFWRFKIVLLRTLILPWTLLDMLQPNFRKRKSRKHGQSLVLITSSVQLSK